MIRLRMEKTAWLLLLVAALALSSFAQKKPPVSPHETTKGTIGGNTISIEYGRPSAKGRQIVGNLIPIGKVWRLGADEATKLTTPVDIEINGLKVPAGSYSLFMLLEEGQAPQLIVNKVADQWGAFKYDQSQDLGRVTLDAHQKNPFTETLTITIESTGDKTGRIGFAWGNGAAHANVKVL